MRGGCGGGGGGEGVVRVLESGGLRCESGYEPSLESSLDQLRGINQPTGINDIPIGAKT